jgi:predicted AAA+ superfamily ATPase
MAALDGWPFVVQRQAFIPFEGGATIAAKIAFATGRNMNFQEPLSGLFERIARAIERLGPRLSPRPDFGAAEAFVWQAEMGAFLPVKQVNRLTLSLLKGIDAARDTLLENTRRFAAGLPANNALLWGARGMGKSSLVKAVHAEVPRLTLIEIHREDVGSLPHLLTHLREAPDRQFILFCDDLSFEALDASYKSLKAVLEGGIEGRPDNVLFYATSNRRHLMPREMVENERSTAIHPGEAVEEKLSLSDRFGLWIGFHNCSQDDYLAMVRSYTDHYRLPIDQATLRNEALAWALARGSRSGRVAWQYIQDVAGRLGKTL